MKRFVPWLPKSSSHGYLRLPDPNFRTFGIFLGPNQEISEFIQIMKLLVAWLRKNGFRGHSTKNWDVLRDVRWMFIPREFLFPVPGEIGEWECKFPGNGKGFFQISPFPVIPRIYWNFLRDLPRMKISPGIPIPISRKLGNWNGNSPFPGNDFSHISVSFPNWFTLRIADIY